MTLNRLALAYVMLGLAAPALPARAADCFVQKAVRVDAGVKVVLFRPKGNPPDVAVPMTVIRADGSRTFINQLIFTSMDPAKTITVNPRTYVMLQVGDELDYVGMDNGCTVRAVRVSAQLGLRIKGGLPPIPGRPGLSKPFSYFMPVDAHD